MYLFELIKYAHISYRRTKFIPVPEYHVYMIYTHLFVYVYIYGVREVKSLSHV